MATLSLLTFFAIFFGAIYLLVRSRRTPRIRSSTVERAELEIRVEQAIARHTESQRIRPEPPAATHAPASPAVARKRAPKAHAEPVPARSHGGAAPDARPAAGALPALRRVRARAPMPPIPPLQPSAPYEPLAPLAARAVRNR
jgi:hypothetical protein